MHISAVYTSYASCTTVAVLVTFLVLLFCRAMLRRARYCYGKSSVRPPVRLSVTLTCRDHIDWNTSKIIRSP